MKATAEISMYPLHENYEAAITAFILRLKQNKDLTVDVNGLSTQLFGDYDRVMNVLQEEMKLSLEEQTVVFVIKLTKGLLTAGDLPEILK